MLKMILDRLREGRLARRIVAFVARTFPRLFVSYANLMGEGMIQAQQIVVDQQENLLGQYKELTDDLTTQGKQLRQWFDTLYAGNMPLHPQAFSNFDVDTVYSGRLYTLDMLNAAHNLIWGEPSRANELLPNPGRFTPRAIHFSTFQLGVVAVMLNRALSVNGETARENLDRAIEEADQFVWTIQEVADATGEQNP